MKSKPNSPCKCVSHKGITGRRLAKYTFETRQEVNGWRILRETKDKFGQSVLECVCTTCDKLQHKQYHEIGKMVCRCHSREKAAATTLARYGVDNAFKLASIRDKQRSPTTQKKAEASRVKTNLERFGVTNWAKTDAARLQRHKQHLLYTIAGQPLIEWCKTQDISYTASCRVFKLYGEEKFLDWAKNVKNGNSSLEMFFIKHVLPEATQHNKRLPGANIRPDFKLSDKIFVECDGLYFHSEVKYPEKNWHADRRRIYESLGYRVYMFREDEIFYKPEIVRSILDGALGKSKKIDARKCVLRRAKKPESNEFLLKNHLMGKDAPTTRAAVLEYEGEAVAIMTVRMKGGEMEIARFCPMLGCNIRGGFSRLLSYWKKKLLPQSIISFCDLRYGDGHSYEKLGFHMESEAVSFKWTNGRETFHRLRCVSPVEAKEKGWFRIWDAGQRKYRLDIAFVL
jgi:very-short-patch-repair endonuclease